MSVSALWPDIVAFASALLVVKATATLVPALIAQRLLRRASASARHLVLVVAFGILLVLPIGYSFAPPIEFAVTPRPTEKDAPELVVVIDAAAKGEPRPPKRLTSLPPAAFSMRTALVGIWAAGVAWFFIPIAVGFCQVRRVRRFGVPWLKGQQAATRVAASVGFARPVTVLLHEAVTGPMTFGARSPVVVFPRETRGWSERHIENALFHELEHVRRADWVVRCLARICCALYWFHPLVWVCWHRLNLESERAADDAVVQRVDALQYAEQLISIAELLARPRCEPFLAMASRNDLPARIAALLDSTRRRRPVGRVAVAAASAAIAAGAFLVAPVHAVVARQGSQDRPRFEVASIKPNRSGAMEVQWTFQNGRFTAVNVTLKALMRSAYGLPQQPLADFQMTGGPGWLDASRFDVLAQVPGDAARGSGVMSAAALAMLRTLLEERFQLRTHFEPREQAIYVLVLDKQGRLGPQLRQRTVECSAIASGAAEGEPCGGRIFPGTVSARGISMTQMVSGLARLMPNVGRMVVDRTGLTGTYDVDLTWTPDQSQAPVPTTEPVSIPPIDPDGPSLFSALREQLGLRLDSARGLVQVLVIESALAPTAD